MQTNSFEFQLICEILRFIFSCFVILLAYTLGRSGHKR